MSRRGILRRTLFGLLCLGSIILRFPAASAQDTPSDIDLQRDRVGHWKLRGDCQDSSGRNNHGRNHGADLKTSRFDGRSAFVEVPSHQTLRMGRGDFTISEWTEFKITALFREPRIGMPRNHHLESIRDIPAEISE